LLDFRIKMDILVIVSRLGAPLTQATNLFKSISATIRPMSSDIYFMQCNQEECRFRFPLDLDQFEGKVCPICGGKLNKKVPRVAQWQPDWIEAHLPEICLVLDNIRSAHNLGSIFRTAEGAGVTRLHLCGLTPSPDKTPAIAKAALGSERRLPWKWHANGLECCENLKESGFQLVCIEAIPQARSIFSEALKYNNSKIALVLGSEPAGIDPAIIETADKVVYIPMSGKKSSLNVSVACGIALYSVLSSFQKK
jgi:23S rRNA (guanosine2251-2'-O)-methyltransferase